MKMLGLVLSFLFGKMNSKTSSIKESALEIFEEITHRSRKMVFLSILGIGAVAFFTGGLFISLLDATRQYDTQGVVYWSSTLIAGGVIALLAAGLIAYVFMRAWPGASPSNVIMKETKEEVHHHHTSSLEQALAVLVMDFVKEREHRRAHPTEPHAPPRASRPHRGEDVPREQNEDTKAFH